MLIHRVEKTQRHKSKTAPRTHSKPMAYVQQHPIYEETFNYLPMNEDTKKFVFDQAEQQVSHDYPQYLRALDLGDESVIPMIEAAIERAADILIKEVTGDPRATVRKINDPARNYVAV